MIATLAALVAFQTPSQYDSLKNSVVRLYVEVKEKKKEPRFVFAGTGWFYKDSRHLITAKHVAQDDAGKSRGKFQIKYEDGYTVNIDATKTKVGYDDIALMVLDDDARKNVPLTLATTDVAVGDALFKIGFPYQVAKYGVPAYATGVVGQIITKPGEGDKGPLLGHTITLNPGDSGGPLFNTKGEVVGIDVSGYPGSGVLNFAVPLATIKSELSLMLING